MLLLLYFIFLLVKECTADFAVTTVTPDPMTSDFTTVTPEPITVTPEPMTSDLTTVTPEPITVTPEPMTSDLTTVTPEPITVTPEPMTSDHTKHHMTTITEPTSRMFRFYIPVPSCFL